MAILDARNLDDGSIVSTDICVIRAGPAGIAIARRFRNTSVRVALLESGGLEADAATQSLAAGQIVGLPYPNLDVARLRLLGGTSNRWSGNIRPLDPIDFTERPWVPHSGWPFNAEELTPYIARPLTDFLIQMGGWNIGPDTGPGVSGIGMGNW